VETTAFARTSAVVASPSSLTAEPGPDLARLHAVRPRWLTAYTAALVVLDGAAMAAATLTAKISWLGINPESLHIRSVSIPYGALTLATVPTWLVLLALAGGYDLGPFGSNAGSWTRVVRAGAQFLAVVAVAYYVLHLAMLGRGVLAGTVPLAVLLTLAARGIARLGLDQLRRRGHARRTALAVGSRPSIDRFVRQIDAHAAAGVAVVGETVIGETDAGPPGHTAVEAIDAVATTGAESLIVTGGLAQGQLRDIAWALEGTGVELLVIPTPSDIEGLRSEIRPVAGLPLLHLDS
jgi:FlaA1/EpsC-like NDP-sugar epimerase